MKQYVLRILPEVQAHLRTLHPEIKSKIRSALEEIVQNPDIGKALEDELTGLYTYRMSFYRIIYRILRDKIEVQVVDIDKRSVVYSKLEKSILESK